MSYLTDYEIDLIWKTYEDPLRLIDFVDNCINKREKQTPIKYPFKYVQAVADSQNWPLQQE